MNVINSGIKKDNPQSRKIFDYENTPDTPKNKVLIILYFCFACLASQIRRYLSYISKGESNFISLSIKPSVCDENDQFKFKLDKLEFDELLIASPHNIILDFLDESETKIINTKDVEKIYLLFLTKVIF